MRPFQLLPRLLLLVLIALPVKAVFAAGAISVLQAQGTPSTVGSLISFAGAFLTSALLGGVKHLDTSITNGRVFRKLQPVFTLAGALAAPWIASKTGVAIDPATFTTAPVATIAAITAAELGTLFKAPRPS